MRRRQFMITAGLSLFVRLGLAATNQAPSKPESVKGKLIQHKDAASTLQTDDGRTITLTGDEETEKVLHDPRLNGMMIEAFGHPAALGHPAAAGHFAVEPNFENNLYVLKDGKRLKITYWCDVCSIRTYAPGTCVCCQKWTDLDLRDPNQE